MTSLICLVQRLSLGNPERTIVKENERFEVEELAAQIYIRGGIAKRVEPTPEPVKVTVPAKVVEVVSDNKPVQPEPENVISPDQPDEVQHVGRKAKKSMR